MAQKTGTAVPVYLLKIEMWEMFDFGHEASIKELREAMNRLLKETDEEKTRSEFQRDKCPSISSISS